MKDHDLLKAAGMNIHSIKNIIYLPTSADAHSTRSVHNGYHSKYNTEMRFKMDAILETGKENNWTKKEYKKALNKLITTERANLRKGKTILNKKWC
ncbi:AHH domain-containing protein [Snodgrassella alvi]|uniref:AHH domain-containing protein n=1 Tax=Snodgrassella alvi TaxID=1196083 RepID=UPI0035124973